MRTTGGLTKIVAVKALNDAMGWREGAVNRLMDEGAMMAAVNHPVILRVYDLVPLEGRLALITEYVEGEDLSECVKGNVALSPRALFEVIAAVAEALDAAWSTELKPGVPLRMVHRDIKPSNIRIGRRGQSKLLDFGIARTDELGRSSQTKSGMVIGSLSYMAPERFGGREFETAADVYSLGVCALLGLTGSGFVDGLSPPRIFGLSQDLVAWNARLEATMGRVPSDIPEACVDLIRRCLQRDPRQRPTAAKLAELAEELVFQLPGVSLKVWARARDWAPPGSTTGAWTDRTLTEEMVSSLHTVLPDHEMMPEWLEPGENDTQVRMETPKINRSPLPTQNPEADEASARWLGHQIAPSSPATMDHPVADAPEAPPETAPTAPPTGHTLRPSDEPPPTDEELTGTQWHQNKMARDSHPAGSLLATIVPIDSTDAPNEAKGGSEPSLRPAEETQRRERGDTPVDAKQRDRTPAAVPTLRRDRAGSAGRKPGTVVRRRQWPGAFALGFIAVFLLGLLGLGALFAVISSPMQLGFKQEDPISPSTHPHPVQSPEPKSADAPDANSFPSPVVAVPHEDPPDDVGVAVFVDPAPTPTRVPTSTNTDRQSTSRAVDPSTQLGTLPKVSDPMGAAKEDRPRVVAPTPKVDSEEAQTPRETTKQPLQPSQTQPVSTAAAPAPTAHIRSESALELRSASHRYPSGSVPAGRYEIWNDFGAGMAFSGVLHLTAGDEVEIECNPLLLRCTRL